MRKHYAAALHGQNTITRALTRLWSSRFSGITAMIMIPEASEKLSLTITWSAALDQHQVRLTRRNWRTGEISVLYAGPIDANPKRPRAIKD